MFNFLLSSADLFPRIARLICLVAAAVGIIWRMYAYLDTHTIEGPYAVMPIMCALTAMFLTLTGIAWSFRAET